MLIRCQLNGILTALIALRGSEKMCLVVARFLINPGTATITITGIGNYTGTRIKTFEIVDCVSSLVSGKTYQIIPKNNSATAV